MKNLSKFIKLLETQPISLLLQNYVASACLISQGGNHRAARKAMTTLFNELNIKGTNKFFIDVLATVENEPATLLSMTYANCELKPVRIEPEDLEKAALATYNALTDILTVAREQKNDEIRDTILEAKRVAQQIANSKLYKEIDIHLSDLINYNDIANRVINLKGIVLGYLSKQKRWEALELGLDDYSIHI